MIYAQGQDSESNALTDIFMQREEGDKIVVEIAKKGQMIGYPEEGEAFVLFNGKTLDGVPGTGNFAISCNLHPNITNTFGL